MSDCEEEPLDPRVQHELEHLNKASLLINDLENKLDEARAKFKSHLTSSTQQLETLQGKLGNCIEKAKPYYDCRLKATEVQLQTQQAATRYERAIGMQAAAREMVELAEQGYMSKKRQQSLDTTWQEMLNHATIKVMDAENERIVSQGEHHRMTTAYAKVQEEVNEQYREHKRSIAKSKEYYEVKATLHAELEQRKSDIEKVQKAIEKSKKLYSDALSNLEAISNEIHGKRQERKSRKSPRLGIRGSGVGAESPPNPILSETRAKSTEEIIISFPPNKDKTPELHRKSVKSVVKSSSSSRVSSVKSSSDISHNNNESKVDAESSGDKSPRSSGKTSPDNLDSASHAPVTIQVSGPLPECENNAEDTSNTSTVTKDDSSDTKLMENSDVSKLADNNSNTQIDENGLAKPQLANDTMLNNKPTEDIEHNISNRVKRTMSDFSIKSFGSDSSSLMSPIVRRHRRAHSSSIKLSARRLLDEATASDTDSNSLNSFVVLDDEGVVNAMTDQFFNGSYEADLLQATHEDYSRLPDQLAEFQKSYEENRKSLGHSFNLEQVMKLLESSADESRV